MKKITQLSLVVVLAVTFIAGAMRVLPAQAQDPSPATVVNTQNVTLFGVISSTTDANGAGQNVAGYGVADCYSNLDVGAGTDVRITTTLQHALGSSGNYVSYSAMTAQTADGAVFTRVPIYGNYLRASVDISTTGGITVGVSCVVKDNGGT